MRPYVIIKDRGGKLQYLSKDSNAQQLGNFSTQAQFAEKLGVKFSLLREFFNAERYKAENLGVAVNNNLENLFELVDKYSVWRHGSLAEFKEFWPQHSEVRLKIRLGQPTSLGGTFFPSSNVNKKLVIQALKNEFSNIQSSDGWMILATHCITFEKQTAEAEAMVWLSGASTARNGMAQVYLSSGRDEYAKLRLPLLFDLDVKLGTLDNTGIHVRSCRLVLRLEGAETVRLQGRKRYPDKPQLSIKPDEIAKSYGLSIAPDDVGPGQVSWALSLTRGPIHTFTLCDLVEIASADAGAVIGVEIQASTRQLTASEEIDE